jgi:hypothetical protein
MSKKLTQINLSSVVSDDGKLPLPLTDTGLPLYTRAMDAIDRLEEGIQRKDRKIVRDAQASLIGTMKYIQSQLCYEYSPIRAKQDNPDLWDVVCFSGNLGRPHQHACCVDCILFDTNNNPHLNSKQSHIPLVAVQATA